VHRDKVDAAPHPFLNSLFEPLRRRARAVTPSHSHRGDDPRQFLAAIGNHKLVHVGGALKSCLVAEGKADLYARLGPTRCGTSQQRDASTRRPAAD
jgi:3'-phosphoadenosine 5'-phosphosulfate (PAPS) 3'-phosphatase